MVELRRPHLIVKDQEVVVKCQGDRADQQILVQDSVPKTTHKPTAECTFSVVLKAERIARVMNSSEKRVERTSLGHPAPTAQRRPSWVGSGSLGNPSHCGVRACESGVGNEQPKKLKKGGERSRDWRSGPCCL